MLVNEGESICNQVLLKHFRSKYYFLRLVTVVETWIHYYEPENKDQSRHWVRHGSSRPKKLKNNHLPAKWWWQQYFWAQRVLWWWSFYPRKEQQQSDPDRCHLNTIGLSASLDGNYIEKEVDLNWKWVKVVTYRLVKVKAAKRSILSA